LPKEVFQQAADEMMDYKGLGISVLEMSHRSPEFTELSNKAKSDLREFLSIPDNFEIFFF
jgi:phosphoserine aminotransferase